MQNAAGRPVSVGGCTKVVRLDEKIQTSESGVSRLARFGQGHIRSRINGVPRAMFTFQPFASFSSPRILTVATHRSQTQTVH